VAVRRLAVPWVTLRTPASGPNFCGRFVAGESKGVRRVISDQHLSLKAAVDGAGQLGLAEVLGPLMRTVLARVPRSNTHMVIAAIQPIFAQTDAQNVCGQS
jgi:transposase-like protein